MLSLNHTIYINSTDIDVTLALMPSHSDLIIDVSEVDPADLLTKINAKFDEDTLTFDFEEVLGALMKGLEENKNIILKGEFSQDMQQALTDLLYQRQQMPPSTPKLILIASEPDLFPCIASYTHAVTLKEKKQLLPKDRKLCDEQMITRSLAELDAICRSQARNGFTNVDQPWVGMKSLPMKPLSDLDEFDLSEAEQKSDRFNAERMTAVEQAFGNSPFVFLAGMSGVGKSSFVKQIWTKKHPNLYIGENNIKAWADSTSTGLKTLFIDEANISSRQWSEFEGLFNTSPAILIGHEYIALTPEHKVIFAGNPISYGGERQMASLFKRHGNSVVFEPMPVEYIYHEILKPSFFGVNQVELEEIAQPILRVADYLSLCSQNNVLISPRELVSMALFSQCYLHNTTTPLSRTTSDEDYAIIAELLRDEPPIEHSPLQDEDPFDIDFVFDELLSDIKRNPITENPIAQYYAYHLARPLVPDQYLTEFDRQFKAPAPRRRPLFELSSFDFLTTESNRPAREALEDFLNLRQIRQTHSGNPTQQYGGLGGLILEGEPGIGKTELVAKTLIAHGLTRGDWHTHNSQQVFYILPVSTPFLQKKEFLLKAFHEGAVVVVDEMNSAPMMESLLNDLLMGQTPDGQHPKNPGFLIIATQNPVTMAGRIKASSAIQRRMQTVSLPNYSTREMIDILQHKGLSEDMATDMVCEYLDIRQNGEVLPHQHQLCFRDVLKRAQMELNAAQAKMRGSSFDEATSRKRPRSDSQDLQSLSLFSIVNKKRLPENDNDKPISSSPSL